MNNLFKIVFCSFFLLLCAGSKSSVWIPGWKDATSLTTKRGGAAVVVASGFIYIIGGVNNEGFLKTTEYAKIHKDGSLGPWKPGSLLNEERGHAEAVVHNGFIYIIGGANGPNGENLLSSAERTRLLSDGTMMPWIREKSSMDLPRRCSKLIVKDNYIYAIGGYGGRMLDTAAHSEILDDGSLGEWVSEQEIMNVPHYVNGMQETMGIVYVVGGHAQKRGGGITNVEWSKIMDSGGLELWKKASPLNSARYGLSTAVYGDYLYALGGISGVEFSDFVEKAKINPNGGLSAWQSTTTLSQPRATFGTVVFKDWIYILGGAYLESFLTRVEYATVNDTGDIGFWGSKNDETTYKEKLKALSASNKAHLPNEGVVKKILQTDMYSYIQVSIKSHVIWIAAPKIEIDVNTRIRFSEASLMSNFQSKQLKHTFPSIFFVSQVQKVDSK